MRRWTLMAAGLLVTGCPSPDADGDGWADTEDCAPNNAAVHPDAQEVCNRVDDDCNEVIDDNASDATQWYADADTDMFGNAADSVTACTPPVGYLADATDCDDTDRLVHPEAIESCNDLDDDCDDEVDEDAWDATTWYPDADGDGYGDIDGGVAMCANPGGYLEEGTDCDDSLDTVHPEADEYCNGVDDDCDEVVDEDAVDPLTWYADNDGDGYGDDDRTRRACEAPEDYIADGGDCDDVRATVNPEAEEVHDQRDNDCNDLCDEGFIGVGDLVFTEFHSSPGAAPEPDGEWFEVFNTTEDDVAICGGWTFEDDDGESHAVVVATPLIVDADDHLVLGYTDDDASNGTAGVDYAYGSDLNLDSADELTMSFDGTVIDEIAWDLEGAWSDCDSAAHSCQLDSRYRNLSGDLEDTNDDPDFWCFPLATFGAGDYGNPGDISKRQCYSGGGS